jgi:hypothetical protein
VGTLLQCLLNLLVERCVEISNYIVPYKLAVCNAVEILLYLGCKAIVKDIFKVLSKEIGYKDSNVLWEQFLLLGAGNLPFGLLGNFIPFKGKMYIFSLNTLPAVYKYVAAFLGNCGDCRGVC